MRAHGASSEHPIQQRADRRAMVIAALDRRRERHPLARRRELLSAFTRRATGYYAAPDYAGHAGHAGHD